MANSKFLAHRVIDENHHTWYPLHHLTRWSGAVATDAPITDVKRAMAEAKIAIDMKCQQHQWTLDQLYKKIGQTICIDERAFPVCIDTWRQTRPENPTLQSFEQNLAQIQRELFHPDESESSGSVSSSSGLSSKALSALMTKYTYTVADASTSSVSSISSSSILPSAGLSASPATFSLSAFLDQHLQATNPAQFDRVVEQTQRDVQTLRNEWTKELAQAEQTNPSLIAEEISRIQLYQQQLDQLMKQHQKIMEELAQHNDRSKPLYTKVETLQKNMSFLTHVQSYEHLLKQTMELSEKCREEIALMDSSSATGGVVPSGSKRSGLTATSPQQSASPSPIVSSSSSAAATSPQSQSHVQNVCVTFLKLLRLYQSIQESSGMMNPAVNRQSADASGGSSSWSGIPHLQSLMRTRILSLLHPLRSKLVGMYQQALHAIHWPQTTTTLLLGMHEHSATLAASPSATHGREPSGASPSPSPPHPNDSVSHALRLFSLLTENLIRVQTLLVQCGLNDELKAVEKEIRGVKNNNKDGGKDEKKKDQRQKGVKLWILTLLLQPIYKRFYYHFDSSTGLVGDPTLTGSGAGVDGTAGGTAATQPSANSSGTHTSLTNRLDKPEWVCTFLEKTYEDHKDFLETIVQPIVNQCRWRKEYEAPLTTTGDVTTVFPPAASAGQPYEFCLEFLESLLSLYHAKLSRSSTLNILLSDSGLLRHTMQELVSFEGKLEAVYHYPISSSKRLTLLDAFLVNQDAFQAMLKGEKDLVNKGLDDLRNLKRPWELIAESRRNGGGAGETDSSDEDEEFDDGIHAPSSIDPLADEDPSSSFLQHSSSSATHSSFGFLSLVNGLTLKYKSFKYLNHRLLMLKEIQFKLFEIYEEDLIRAFQENWKKVTENVKKGGLKNLMLPRRRGTGGSAGTDISTTTTTTSAKNFNPISLWQTHCGLLNSIFYLENILREWNEEIIFLELFYFYTHKQRIQASFLQAYKDSHPGSSETTSSAMIVSPATSIGGVLIKGFNTTGSSSGGITNNVPSSEDTDEVYITSEELALWMAQGGKIAPMDSMTGHAAVASAQQQQTQSSIPLAVNPASSSNPDHPEQFHYTSVPPELLPAGFAETMRQLNSLKQLVAGASPTHRSGPNGLDQSHSSNSSRPTIPSGTTPAPTGESLFPKVPSTESDASSSLSRSVSNAASTAHPSATTAALPLDLSISGTLFEPILASYTSLHEELLHSLVQVIVNSFRDALRGGYAKQGHMVREGTELMSQPGLEKFFRGGESPGTDASASPSTAATNELNEHDWMALDSTVDISSSLCQPLLDLKTQLIVVHRYLTRSLHRAFWTSVCAKLSQILYDDCVEGQYFTRAGSLQFMRDMRAIFVVFEIYAPITQTGRGGSAVGKNPYFKLVQDAINILLLSPAQLHALDVQLTTGSIASGSASTLRHFLSKPPYNVQRLTAQQVIELIAHMRTEREDSAREGRDQLIDQDQQPEESHEQEEEVNPDASYEDEEDGESAEPPVEDESNIQPDEDEEESNEAPEPEDEQPDEQLEEDQQEQLEEDEPTEQDDADEEDQQLAEDDSAELHAQQEGEEVEDELEQPNMDEFEGFPEEEPNEVNDAVPQ